MRPAILVAVPGPAATAAGGPRPGRRGRRRRHGAGLGVRVRGHPLRRALAQPGRAHPRPAARRHRRADRDDVAAAASAAATGWRRSAACRAGSAGCSCSSGWRGSRVYNVALNAGERHVDAGTASMIIQIAPGADRGAGRARCCTRGSRGRSWSGTVVALLGHRPDRRRHQHRGDGRASGGCVTGAGGAAGARERRRLRGARSSRRRWCCAGCPACVVTWAACTVGCVACLPFAGELVARAGGRAAAGLVGRRLPRRRADRDRLLDLGLRPRPQRRRPAVHHARTRSRRSRSPSAGCSWARCRCRWPSSAVRSAWSGWRSPGAADGCRSARSRSPAHRSAERGPAGRRQVELGQSRPDPAPGRVEVGEHLGRQRARRGGLDVRGAGWPAWRCRRSRCGRRGRTR